MSAESIVITAFKRTPLGAFQGCFSTLATPTLGAACIQALLTDTQLAPELVEEVLLGCVLPAGLGQAPARQAALAAKLPQQTTSVTLNKVCGSGLRAIMLAHDMLQLQQAHILIAGGMENMTRAPHLLLQARCGYRMGHGALKDHMFLDGLEDAYENKLMGFYADATAAKYKISRSQQDEFTLASLERANLATSAGAFAAEITPVEVVLKKSTQTITEDEIPKQAKPDKIPKLRPAFEKDGTVTAANASSISDGAAAVMLMQATTANQHGLTPLATIKGHCSFAHAPEWFTTAPVGAIEKLLKQVGWSIQDVDLFEINEAFAVVTLAVMQQLDIPHEKVNVLGGACALGHPIGASGARIVCTLVNALAQRQAKRGIAAVCIGGGEACAIAVERCD